MVAIEKGAFESPSTKVANFSYLLTYMYIYIYIYEVCITHFCSFSLSDAAVVVFVVAVAKNNLNTINIMKYVFYCSRNKIVLK